MLSGGYHMEYNGCLIWCPPQAHLHASILGLLVPNSPVFSLPNTLLSSQAILHSKGYPGAVQPGLL